MMKTMKMMMTAVMLMIASTACTGQDKVITEKDLPASAQKLMKEHFADKQVAIVQIERDKRGYETDLSNGLEVRFNKQFKVVEIDN